MDKDYTHISVILDRTGSMETIRDDTIGGFNTFLEEQQKQEGKATLTLVQFDTQDPYEVIHQFTPIKKVPKLTHQTYVPRAMTPLLDAIGRGINDLDQQLNDLKKSKRPSKIVFVVITDGQENSSREFRKDQIEKMIKEQDSKNNWQFVFLSADLASIADAGSYGFQAKSVMAFDKDGAGTSAMYSSLSKSVGDFRRAAANDVSFSKKDRSKQKSEGKRK